MVGLDHGGVHAPEPEEDPVVSRRRIRLGFALFCIYAACYALYMGLIAFAPHIMRRVVWGGVNLAIAYGLGLIVLALVLSLLYSWLGRQGQAIGARELVARRAGDRS